jgi:hypothetical protein
MHRDTEGKFAKFWTLRRKLAAAGIILCASIALVGKVAEEVVIDPWLANTVTAAGTPKVFAAEMKETREMVDIDAAKEKVIDMLEKCESGGKNEEDGIVVLDTNNVGSYGVVQWQRKSVMHYHHKRTGEKLNGRDAILLALDRERARDLAKWVIFDTDAGVATDWVNCSRMHGLQTRVDLIKELQQ